MIIMKSALFCFFIFIFSNQISAQKNSFSYEKSGKDLEISEIQSKISKDLFFRGEVADYIVENNLTERITSKKFSSYGEAREFLIFWIAANPKTAAEFYCAAKSGDPLARKGEISYVITSGGLTERFKDLVETLRKAAQDDRLSFEEKRLASARLFEGFVEYGDGSSVETGSDKKQFRTVNKSAVESDLSAFKLNASALSYTEKKIRNLLPEFSKAASLSKDKRIKSAFKLFEKSGSDFLMLYSSLSGRKNITSKEAEKLKNLIFISKRSAFSFFALKAAQDLREIALKIPDSLLKEKILFWAERFEKNYSLFQNPSFSDKEAADLLTSLGTQEETLKKYAQAYFLAKSLEEQINSVSFSGYYDKFFYILFHLFYPGNEYDKVLSFLQESAKKIKTARENILNLKIEENYDYSFLSGISVVLAKKRRISSANLKMQFLCFEFFYPVEVNVYPKIKIKQNILKIIGKL